MLQTLKDEGAADLAKKTQCDDEYQKITKTVNKLDWKIKNNKAQIAKLEGLIELRTKEKEETIQKIKETIDYMDEAKKERKAENDAFLQAKKDDETAIGLLEDAKAAFTKFGKEQGISMLAEPEFARDKDDAPDATFSDKGNNKLKSKGVVALFDYILEDLADEITNDKKAEAKSQTEYEEEMATAQKLLDDLKEKKVTLEGIIAKRETDKKDENTEMNNNNKDETTDMNNN